MSPKTVGERPRHNPQQLCCPFSSCHQSFGNQSGLTNHICSACHQNSAWGPGAGPKHTHNTQTRRVLKSRKLRCHPSIYSTGTSIFAHFFTCFFTWYQSKYFCQRHGIIRVPCQWWRWINYSWKQWANIEDLSSTYKWFVLQPGMSWSHIFINYVIFQGTLAMNMATICQQIHLLLDIPNLIQKTGHHTRIR